MAAGTKFQNFTKHKNEGVHNFASHTLKVMLTNVAPVATNVVKADLTEIAAGNGYTAGGLQATLVSSSQTSGTYRLVLNDTVWTAAGGSIGPFRYAVLYNDTPTSPADPLIAWWDYGSALTLANTETFTWDADGATGVLTDA